MGVPGLMKWIRENFPECFFRKLKRCDCLYIDANAPLYSIVPYLQKYQAGQDNSEVFLIDHNLIYKYYLIFILKCIELYKPKLLYIAFDGPPPLAKQYQQRQRRFISEPINNFDLNCFTPGTEMMYNLSLFLKKELMQIEDCHIILSSANVPGEGEHKIMKFIRNFTDKVKNTSVKYKNLKFDNVIHCILGADGDLFMLGLTTTKTVILCRPIDMEFIVKKMFDKNNLEPKYYDRFDYFNFTIFKEKLFTIKKIHHLDFIFLCFLLGNDFVPRLKCLYTLKDGINYLLHIYGQFKEKNHTFNIIYKNKIQIRPFKRLIEKIAQDEPLLLENNARSPYIICTDWSGRDNILLDCMSSKDSLMMNLYSSKYYNNEIYKDTPFNISKSYLITLLWCFYYYIGISESWRIYYKYLYAPLVKDLDKFMFEEYIKNNNQIPILEKQNPVTPFIQLISVLPIRSFDLVPEELQAALSSLLKNKDLFPDIVTIDYSGKQKKHEGVVRVPFINPTEIIKHIRDLPILKDKKNKFEQDIMI